MHLDQNAPKKRLLSTVVQRAALGILGVLFAIVATVLAGSCWVENGFAVGLCFDRDVYDFVPCYDCLPPDSMEPDCSKYEQHPETGAGQVGGGSAAGGGGNTGHAGGAGGTAGAGGK